MTVIGKTSRKSHVAMFDHTHAAFGMRNMKNGRNVNTLSDTLYTLQHIHTHSDTHADVCEKMIQSQPLWEASNIKIEEYTFRIHAPTVGTHAEIKMHSRNMFRECIFIPA